jgi:PKD repeat protein
MFIYILPLMEETREARERRVVSRALITAGLAAGATLAPAAVAQADIITVDTLADGIDVPGATTLREAVIESNKGACGDETPLQFDADTIRFAAELSGTITLADGPVEISELCAPPFQTLPIYDDVEIDGDNRITISADDQFQILVSYFPEHKIDFKVKGLTLTKGYANEAFGGAIWSIGAVNTIIEDSILTGNTVFTPGGYDDGNYFGGAVNQFNFGFGGSGKLTVRDSLITDNSVEGGNGWGGGIATFQSEAEVIDSTISDNRAIGPDSGGGGGASFDGASWPIEISGSTFSGNTTTEDGGGIGSYGTEITMTNSTVYGNEADGTAGGILLQRDVDYGYGTAELRNVTVSHNTSGGNGGGIRRQPNGNQSAKPTLTNTIVSDNAAGGAQANVLGHFDSAFSLLETAPSTVVDTVTGSTIIGQDPQLGALAANGGDTETAKPAQTSPAIDKGKASGGPATDQRGQVRPFDVPSFPNSSAVGADGADIGAVELGASETPGGGGGNTPPTANFNFDPASPLTGQVVTFTSASSDTDGVIEEYAWDLDEDGQFDDGTTPQVTKSYPAVGNITVSLRVIDDDDAPAQISKDVTVTAAPNQTPTAQFEFTPAAPQAGQEVAFSSTSTDPDGQIASVAWDLDGDGQYDNGTTPSISRVFPDAGAFQVRLRVTDNGSPASSNDVTRTVTVAPAGGGPGPDNPGGPPAPAPGLTPGGAFNLVQELRKCSKKKKKKKRKKCRRKALKKVRAASIRIEPSGEPVRGLPAPITEAQRLGGSGR